MENNNDSRIYTSDSYLRIVQSARTLSKGLQGIYSSPNYIKSIQSAQKMAEAFKLSVPKVYYNQNTLKAITKLAESLSKSSFASIGNKDLYEALQRNPAFQMKVIKQEDFIKPGEKNRQSMPDIAALSSNLQRAAEIVQTVEFNSLDEIDDEIYDEYDLSLIHI